MGSKIFDYLINHQMQPGLVKLLIKLWNIFDGNTSELQLNILKRWFVWSSFQPQDAIDVKLMQ